MSIRQAVQQELSNLGLDEEIASLALAALDSEDEIERVLAGGEPEVSEELADVKAQVPPIFLQDITVAGFRGIGPEATLEISPGPGLTVVVGRNGSGKSSFSEGLEVLLTGDSYRWKDKPKAWQGGWKNLHQGDSTKITARFQVEGMNKPTIVERTWNEGSEIADSEFFAQHHGQARSDLSGIGWEAPLDLYRPILSYNELSMVESSPTVLHDILAKVLSIGDLPVAVKALAQVRLKRQRYQKAVTQDLKNNILPALDDSEEERAIKVKEALAKRTWDLKVITDLGLEPGADHKILQDIMNLAVPDEKEVAKVAEEINLAYTSLSNISSTEIETAERVMGLLETAVQHYELYHNQPCPVCGEGTLDDSWHTSTLEQIKQLKDTTQGYRKAKKNLDRSLGKARKLTSVPKIPDSDVIDTEELRTIWEEWSRLPDNKDNVSEPILSFYSVVRNKITIVSEQASQIFSEREEQWKAILTKLLEWVSTAQRVVKEKPEIAKIKKAEEAVKTVTNNIRSRRWKPIELQALDLWKDLRLESNVNLCSVELTGAGKMKKVDLQVDVDGMRAEALSVVSQGELSCLALSLFFPRAMLPASPFRFLVIDDPVQAMDPARVDGLARLFAKIAEDRQMIVFTHDNRLPESLRLLNLDHHCLEVVRLAESVVEVSKKRDPVIQYFFDARSIMKDDNFPADMARRVIPGFCRDGLEAACVEAVWRRRLGKGKSHQAIEEELFDAKKLSQKASLVFFDKIDQGGKVFPTISGKWERRLADAYSDANKGTHKKYSGDLPALINDCQSLAERLRRHNV